MDYFVVIHVFQSNHQLPEHFPRLYLHQVISSSLHKREQISTISRLHHQIKKFLILLCRQYFDDILRLIYFDLLLPFYHFIGQTLLHQFYLLDSVNLLIIVFFVA